MEAGAISATIKPIFSLNSFTIKDESDAKRLLKSRLKLKNLILHEYETTKSYNRRILRIKKACFSHLKGLISLTIPLYPQKVPSFIKFNKQIYSNLRKLRVEMSYSPRDLKTWEKRLIRMKHLVSFQDSYKDFNQKERRLSKIKHLGKVQHLDLPCHVTPKRLAWIKKVSIDLEVLDKNKMIPKLPLGLRELSLIDNNLSDKESHKKAFWKMKDQLNSLTNLKVLNLVFPRKSYFHHQSYLFSDLELRNLTIIMRCKVDFSDETLLEMEEYLERTGSLIKIIPSGFSEPEEYLRLLSFLENTQGMIQLEKILYPFHSTGDLPKRVIEYYRKISTKKVEFMFEFHSENGWFDEEKISNFKEMMKFTEKESTIILHFIHELPTEFKKTKEQQIIQAAINLLNDLELGKELIIKVSSDVYGFKMLKSLIIKLFQELPLKSEWIYWQHASMFLADLPEIMNNLKAQNKIKYALLITYHRYSIK